MRRRVIAACLLLLIVLTLTSCEVHWGSARYDVPWWVIAIPTALFIAIVWVVAGKIISDKKYRCLKCNETFYPKWWQAAFSIHVNDNRVFKCPHCGRKGFCRVLGSTEKEI